MDKSACNRSSIYPRYAYNVSLLNSTLLRIPQIHENVIVSKAHPKYNMIHGDRRLSGANAFANAINITPPHS